MPSVGLLSNKEVDVWGDLALCVAEEKSVEVIKKEDEKWEDVLDNEDKAISKNVQYEDYDTVYACVSKRKKKVFCSLSRNNGDTALIAAARRGATEAVRALLGAGAQVNAISRKGESALEAATQAKELGAAAALVRAKAQINASDDSLLRVATLAGDHALVQALLASGAPPLLNSNQSNEEIILLEDDEEIGATSCLLLAVRHPNPAILDAYIRYFREANKRTQLDAAHGARRITALMVAAANGIRDDARACRKLLEAGADFAARDANGRAPLHRAAAADARSAIEALAQAAKSRCESDGQYRAFIDARELGTLRSPLHCAAVACSAGAVAALLAAGADATGRDANDDIPLEVVPTADNISENMQNKRNATLLELQIFARAVADGDLALCLQLAQRGNWPIDFFLDDTSLIAAARRGDIDSALILLGDQGKAKVDARNASGESALAVAAEKGHLSVCMVLLQAGATPGLELSDAGAQLLLQACRSRDAQLVAKLLEVDKQAPAPRTNHITNKGNKPITNQIPKKLSKSALRRALHAAASVADDECVAALLRSAPTRDLCAASPPRPDERPDEKDDDCVYLTQFPIAGDDREPALLAACRANATKCVVLLTRDRGALRTALDDERRCALHHAAATDRASLVEKLCGEDASLVSCRDFRGATPLHAAASAGAGAAIGALLRHGADATLADAKKRTPRDVAVLRNRPSAAAQLDAFSSAIDDGDFDECARLANSGNWPIDWRSSNTGDTALVAAARRGAPDAVSRLLACGASVDATAKTDQGQNDLTPLAAAALASHLDVCAALLAAGASPTELPDRGANLLIAAVVANEPELVDALLAKGASAAAVKINASDNNDTADEDRGSAFLVAVEVGSPKIVRSFIKMASDLNIDFPHGSKHTTAIHAAAARGRAEIVKLLIDAGAKINPIDAEGRSPLHHAAQGDYDEVLRSLVKHKGNIRQVDKRGHTPLAVAQHAGSKSAEATLLMAESLIR
uniref:Uncharacterized protein n=1 Tax=Aureoumbra lagunensis TaxID=44058 RepID=A0A7S3K4I8_9STRA|mmetsp:Transcript_6078/g.9003  ORF Transcript_6078/g.9003 Transcript_6078/m.9003 type:complete len:988 (-) Transcript_6078:397-3360(-)